MATDLTSYLENLKAGAPKLAPWFDGAYSFAQDGDFAHKPEGWSLARPGVVLEATAELTFKAPINGLVSFASPYAWSVGEGDDGEDGADPKQLVVDPALRGLRQLLGGPFYPLRTDATSSAPSSSSLASALVLRVFPQAYLRLARLYHWLNRRGATEGPSQDRSQRPVPATIVVALDDREQLVEAAVGAEDANAQDQAPLVALVKAALQPAIGTGEPDAPGLGAAQEALSVEAASMLPDEPLERSPTYYAAAGTDLLKIPSGTKLTLYVFDEHGHPIDPVSVAHVWDLFADEFTGLASSADDVKQASLVASNRSNAPSQRVLVHVASTSGAAPPKYLRSRLKATGGTFDSATDSDAPVRRIEVGQDETSLKLGYEEDQSEDKGVDACLGTYPEGKLGDEVELRPLSFDFVRVGLCDLTVEVAGNELADPEPDDLDDLYEVDPDHQVPHYKDTIAELLPDGRAVFAEAKRLIEETYLDEGQLLEEAKRKKNVLGVMSPELDPQLPLTGARALAGAPSAGTATLSDAARRRLERLHDAANARIVPVGGGDFPGREHLLIGAASLLVEGMVVRAFPLEFPVEGGEQQQPVRGDGVAGLVGPGGRFFLPLQKIGGGADARFDLLVSGAEGDKKLSYMRGGYRIRLPDPEPAGAPDLSNAYLRVTGVGASRAAAAVVPRAGLPAGAVNLFALIPRTGRVHTLAAVASGDTVIPLPNLGGDDRVYIGAAAGSDKLEDARGFRLLVFTEVEHGRAVPPALAGELRGLLARAVESKVGEQVEPRTIAVLPERRPPEAAEIARHTAHASGDELKAALGDGLLMIDGAIKASMERRDSAIFTDVDGVQEALVTGAPLAGHAYGSNPIAEGNPDGVAGPDTLSVGIALEGRGAHGVFRAWRERSRPGTLFRAWDLLRDVELKEAEPSNDTKQSSHVVAVLRTLSSWVDGLPLGALPFGPLQGGVPDEIPDSIDPRQWIKGLFDNMSGGQGAGQELQGLVDQLKQSVDNALDERIERLWRLLWRHDRMGREGLHEQLRAVGRAISTAERGVYLEMPLFDLFARDDEALAWELTRLSLAQALHRRLRERPDLHVILCLPRDLRSPAGALVEARLYKARVDAWNVLRFGAYHGSPADAVPDEFAIASQVVPFEGALLAHDRVIAFHPVGALGRDARILSSVVVVDDRWMSVGTGALHRKGLTFDGGLDVAIVDREVRGGAHRFVAESRRALLAQRLGLRPEEAPLVRTFADAFATARRIVAGGLRGRTRPFDPEHRHLGASVPVPTTSDELYSWIDPDGRGDGSTSNDSFLALLDAVQLALGAASVLTPVPRLKVNWSVSGAAAGASGAQIHVELHRKAAGLNGQPAKVLRSVLGPFTGATGSETFAHVVAGADYEVAVSVRVGDAEQARGTQSVHTGDGETTVDVSVT